MALCISCSGCTSFPFQNLITRRREKVHFCGVIEALFAKLFEGFKQNPPYHLLVLWSTLYHEYSSPLSVEQCNEKCNNVFNFQFPLISYQRWVDPGHGSSDPL